MRGCEGAVGYRRRRVQVIGNENSTGCGEGGGYLLFQGSFGLLEHTLDVLYLLLVLQHLVCLVHHCVMV